MPVALSVDLRWRIVWLYHYKQHRVEEIADLLVVSKKTVRRILKRYKDTGIVDPTERHGPERTLDAFAEMTLMQSVLSKLNTYLDELQSDLYSSTGITVSLSTICRTFQRLGFTRKKVQHIVLRRSESDRADFAEEMSYIDHNMIVWVDETGSDTRREGIRKFGYALRGITPVSFKLGISGKRLSVIAAMSSRGHRYN